MQTLAKFISIILQPIFIPLYGAVMFTYSDTFLSILPLNLKAYIWMIVFITTGLFPAFIIGLCMRFGSVSDGFISDRTERPLPFFLTFIGYLACSIWLSRAGLPLFHVAPIFGAAFALLVTILVSHFWKISAHLTALGGMCGGIFAFSVLSPNQYPYILILFVLLSGILGWSRMLLKAHTLTQVSIGWLNGFIWVSLAWFIIPLFTLR